jgi:HEAT repeat protein
MLRNLAAPALRRTLACSLFTLLCVVLGGCPKDPYDADTWIDKLDDPSEVERAVTELQRLKDPKAIAPLASVWRKNNKSQRVLRVIIEIASAPAKGDPQWNDAVPVLIEAVDEFEDSDDRSVDNAVLAADALGRAGDPAAVEPLIKAVNKQMPGLSKGQRVRLAAIKALGSFGKDARAVDTLIKVLAEVDTIQQKILEAKNNAAEQAKLNRDLGGRLPIFGATINALAESRNPKALPALLSALYTLPPLYQQVRRAMVSIGPAAVPELIKILKGENKEISDLARKYKFNLDCSQDNMGPDTTCTAPTNLEFKAAGMLGDLYAKEAVPALIDALKKPALPAYFEQDVPGPSQHTAILDSLKKIGDPKSAQAVLDYWQAKGGDPFLYPKPMAVDAYSFLTREPTALPAMSKIIMSDAEEQQLRLAASLSYGRLVYDAKDLDTLNQMVGRYKKAADDADDKASGDKKKYDAAKKAADDAKSAQAKAGGKQAPENVKAATKKAQEAFDKIAETAEPLMQRAAGLRDFQRTFEQHIARAEVGIRCKDDAACYAAELDKTDEQVGKDLEKYIDQSKWKKEEKASLLADLRTGAIERAVIELSKLGDKAQGVQDKLLKYAGSNDGLIRQGVLLALVHCAKLPCDACVKALDDVMKAGEGQSTLQRLNLETEVVREYFATGGRH